MDVRRAPMGALHRHDLVGGNPLLVCPHPDHAPPPPPPDALQELARQLLAAGTLALNTFGDRVRSATNAMAQMGAAWPRPDGNGQTDGGRS